MRSSQPTSQLVSSPVLLSHVVTLLPFKISETTLASDVYAQALSNAAIINIVANNPKAIRAEEIATSTTTAFMEYLQGNGVFIPKIYAQPSVPNRPSSPRVNLVVAVTFAVALIAGLGAGLLWNRVFESDIVQPTQRLEEDGPA